MSKSTPNPIRPVVPGDIAALKRVIDATDMFPSEMLDDMIAKFFDDQENEDIWLTYDTAGDKGGAKAVAYCRPEEMTDRTWNLLLIAVHPDCQGEGIGAALMSPKIS